MLRTEDALEVKLGEDWSDLKRWTVKRVSEIFHAYPDHFFSESDIHSLLCDIANEELKLYGVEPTDTIDGYNVGFVHHEYPTPFRCDMKEYGCITKDEKPYKRGHYDLVILNPNFVESNKLDVVCGKDYQKFRPAIQGLRMEPLIWACEIIFFPRVKNIPIDASKIIEQDALKVQQTLQYSVGAEKTSFCMLGSILVFTSHTIGEALDLKQQIATLEDKINVEMTLSTA